MELNQIKASGTWGNASNTLNRNFEKINGAIEQVKNATTRNKGYYALEGETEEELIAQIDALALSPTIGDKIYIGLSYPYTEFQYTDEGWKKTSESAGAEEVNLGDYYTKTDVNVITEFSIFGTRTEDPSSILD